MREFEHLLEIRAERIGQLKFVSYIIPLYTYYIILYYIIHYNPPLSLPLSLSLYIYIYII